MCAINLDVVVVAEDDDDEDRVEEMEEDGMEKVKDFPRKKRESADWTRSGG